MMLTVPVSLVNAILSRRKPCFAYTTTAPAAPPLQSPSLGRQPGPAESLELPLRQLPATRFPSRGALRFVSRWKHRPGSIRCT